MCFVLVVMFYVPAGGVWGSEKGPKSYGGPLVHRILRWTKWSTDAHTHQARYFSQRFFYAHVFIINERGRERAYGYARRDGAVDMRQDLEKSERAERRWPALVSGAAGADGEGVNGHRRQPRR